MGGEMGWLVCRGHWWVWEGAGRSAEGVVLESCCDLVELVRDRRCYLRLWGGGVLWVGRWVLVGLRIWLWVLFLRG